MSQEYCIKMSQSQADPPPFSEDELRELYWIKNQSIKQTAKTLNVDHKAVKNWFLYYKIPVRSKSSDPIPTKKPPISEDILRDLYWIQKIGLKEIAEKYNTNREKVRNWFAYYRIPVKKPAKPFQHFVPPRPLRRNLVELYWIRGYTYRDIAKHYKTHTVIVRQWFKEYQIPVRKAAPPKKYICPPRDELIIIYWDRGYSLKQIAEQYDVTKWAVRTWFRELKIPRREGIKRRPNEPSRPPKSVLIELYVNENLTVEEIADLYATYYTKVHRWLKYYNIPRRPAKRRAVIRQRPSEHELRKLYYELGFTMNELAYKIYRVSFEDIQEWFDFYNIKMKPPMVANVPWKEWENLCVELASFVIDQSWKPGPCIYTPEFDEFSNVFPDIVVYDNNGDIDYVIDAKLTKQAIRKKDKKIHPYLSKQRIALFWVLQGKSKAVLYRKKGDRKIISIKEYQSFKIPTNIKKVLVIMNSDYLIKSLKERINDNNREVILDLTQRIDRLQTQYSPNKKYNSLEKFLSE
ncbi:MAG: hypothetical protein ACFFCZ_28030 [Promethearchaeota archaeon]